MTLKEKVKLIRQRVEAGESKQKLFDEYAFTEPTDTLAKILAGVTTPELRARYGRLNKLLMAIMILGSITKLLGVVVLVQEFPAPAQIVIFLIAPVINLVFLWDIAHYKGYAYRVYGFLAIASLLRSFRPEDWPANEIEMALFIFFLVIFLIGIGLSFYLSNKLFPDLGFNKAKKGPDGKYRITG